MPSRMWFVLGRRHDAAFTMKTLEAAASVRKPSRKRSFRWRGVGRDLAREHVPSSEVDLMWTSPAKSFAVTQATPCPPSRASVESGLPS